MGAGHHPYITAMPSFYQWVILFSKTINHSFIALFKLLLPRLNKMDFCYTSRGSLNTLAAQCKNCLVVTLSYLAEMESRDRQAYR
jgi:hypothetical protein